MSDMRHTAQHLAAQGRFGDTMLLHVSPAEVDGIASLIPGGLTINPRTGLPEAFFFLPFLASLFGAAAPAAAGVAAATAGAGAAAAGLGGAAAGLGAAGAAAAPVLSTLGALGAPSAAMTAGTLASAAPAIGAAAAPATLAGSGGIGTLLGGTGADALAAPAIGTGGIGGGGGINLLTAPGVDAMTTSSIGGAGAATPAATAATPVAAAPVGTGGIGGGGGINLLAPKGTGGVGGGGGINLLKPTPLPPATVHQTPTSIASSATAPATSVPPLGTFPPAPPPPTAGGGLKGLFTMKNLPMMMMGASALSNALGGLFAKEEKEPKGKSTKGMKYKNTSDEGGPTFPSSSYRPGHDSEWNYFPNYKYANGGIVALANGGMVDPQMQQPQDLSFPMNGVPGTDEAPMLEDIPSSPYPSSQIGTMPEPPASETVEPTTNNDRELVAQTVEAIQGKIPNPGPILLAFVQEFGEPALQDLAQRVKSMPKGGPGGPVNDGQSDSIPAMIDGNQPAALSEGEFVVPADAVSGLGNGSTDAGAQQLQSMVDGVRTMRGGGPVQPPKIDPRQVMPYASGGLVSLYKDGGKVKRPMQGPVDPLYDLEQYRPSILPEGISRLIPSVAGYATTGDWFATEPEMRRGRAMKERAEAVRQMIGSY